MVGTGAGAARAPWWRWPRWSELDEVQRVDLYTRQSLFLLLWLFPVAMLLTFALNLDHRQELLVPLVAATVLLAAVATVMLRQGADTWPTPRVDWRLVVLVLALAVLSALLVRQFEPGVRVGGVLLVTVPVAWALGTLRGRRAVVATTAVVAGIGWLITDATWGLAYGAGVMLFSAFTVQASLWLLGLVTELDAARGTAARLAVAEERLRFSRDVHDVLGRHLSTIAVQSELAATLAHRGDERAEPQMLQVRRAAHEALREARELARGYRDADLERELDGARSLLRSAGIAAEIDAVDVLARLPEIWHEPAAWVVREGVTNVLRHSAARAVTLDWDAERGVLSLTNDAPHPARPDTDGGAGLPGLAERVAARGGRLEVTRETDGFTLRMHTVEAA